MDRSLRFFTTLTGGKSFVETENKLSSAPDMRTICRKSIITLEGVRWRK